MTEEENITYVNGLSPQEKELLEVGKKVWDAGQDPVKILNYVLEARGTVGKAAEIGKQAQGFVLKQWQEFEKAFKGDDEGKPK
ncbi:MAG: hypothetical protein DRI57_32540 [Deltaproteobacteria bacterium]|nr:MAG: hypothetical protein DRI57_32540 [Deltaproteobacteria bacterium]